MTDPVLALRDVAGDALTTAITAAGYAAGTRRVTSNPVQGLEPPYAVLGGDTAIDFATKTSQGAEVTFAWTAWGRTPTEAEVFGDVCLQALTDRDNPLAPSGFTVAGCYFEFRGSILRDEQPVKAYWGVPYRVRFILVEE